MEDKKTKQTKQKFSYEEYRFIYFTATAKRSNIFCSIFKINHLEITVRCQALNPRPWPHIPICILPAYIATHSSTGQL